MMRPHHHRRAGDQAVPDRTRGGIYSRLLRSHLLVAQVGILALLAALAVAALWLWPGMPAWRAVLLGSVATCGGGIAMAGVAWLAARNRARHLAGPITALTVATEDLVAGRRSADLPTDRHDELGQLTRSFNSMLAALRGSQARLQAIYDTSIEGIITIDSQGNIHSASPSAEQMFGYCGGELKGKNVAVLMPDPYRQRHHLYLAGYQDTADKKIVDFDRELTGLRKDGTTFPLYLTVSEMRLDGKRYFTGMVRDISERKRAQQQRRDLGRILEESLNEIYLFDYETLHFLSVNRGARENLGYSMDELRELTPLDLKPEFNAEQFAALLEPLRTEQRPKVEFTTAHRRKDGSMYPVEVHLQTTTFESRKAFVAMILDITERKLVEEELRTKDHAIASAMTAIAFGNLDGRITYANRAFLKMWGFDREEEVLGRSNRELASDPLKVQEIMEAVRARGHWSGEDLARKRDATTFPVELSVMLISDRTDKPIGIMASFVDLTERKESERRLLQAERLSAIGEAMAGLAHESRNALARSQANLRRLRRRLSDRSDLQMFIDGALTAQRDVQHLFDEVRQYAGPVNLNYELCTLGRIVQEAWEDLAPIREHRDARLCLLRRDLNLPCEVDKFAVRRVFRNILENSLAACSDPVQIDVEFNRSRHQGMPAVEVAVRDDGPGLELDQEARIFRAFYTTKTHGTGLGLAICQRIMNEHGGRVAVGSGSTQGAEFLLTFPTKQL